MSKKKIVLGVAAGAVALAMFTGGGKKAPQEAGAVPTWTSTRPPIETFTPRPTLVSPTVTSTPAPELPTVQPTPTAAAPGETYLEGSCKFLKQQGLVPAGGWTTDSVNYTKSRDRDGDGKACE